MFHIRFIFADVERILIKVEDFLSKTIYHVRKAIETRQTQTLNLFTKNIFLVLNARKSLVLWLWLFSLYEMQRLVFSPRLSSLYKFDLYKFWPFKLINHYIHLAF